MDDSTSRFLDAFNVVEDWMRHQLGAPEHEDFSSLLSRLTPCNPGVKRHASTLRRLARLRNLIAHNYSRDEPLAIPTDHSVEQISSIRVQFLSPPLLLSVAASPVETCHLSDVLGTSVKKMHKGVFSQLPIYDGDVFEGLLTAETVVRWLASNLGGGVGLVEEKPVSEVIRHQEDPENNAFLKRTSTVEEGLSAFERFFVRGKRLEAILITQTGRKTEKPLGIVTIHDIPKLRQAIRE